jgi:hypothetical protein
MKIEDMYMDVVSYAKHLENLLLLQSLVDEDTLIAMRKDYIKPMTNVAKEWLEGETK